MAEATKAGRSDQHGPYEITEAARARLRTSPYATVRRVSCEYADGVLFLRGPVPSFYHKQLAQETVSRLRGVSEVINETVVVA
jgi:osmotically-inducible protein OsmY